MLSSSGRYAEFILIKCSKHCPTLQLSPEGFQLICSAFKCPEVFCALPEIFSISEIKLFKSPFTRLSSRRQFLSFCQLTVSSVIGGRRHIKFFRLLDNIADQRLQFGAFAA